MVNISVSRSVRFLVRVEASEAAGIPSVVEADTSVKAVLNTTSGIYPSSSLPT